MSGYGGRSDRNPRAKPVEIGDEKPSALVVDHAGVPERLERPVDVHPDQAKRIRQHLLSDGHFTTVALDQARSPGPKPC